MAKVKKLTREEGTARSYAALNRCLMSIGQGVETETEEQFLKRSQDLYDVLLPLHLKAAEAEEYDAMAEVYRLFFQAHVIVHKRPKKWKTFNRRRLDKVNVITKQVLPALRNLEVLTVEKHGGDKKELARLNKELNKAVEEIIPSLERYVEVNRAALSDADYESDRVTFLKGLKHWMDYTRLEEAVKVLATIRCDNPYATIPRLLRVAPRAPHKIPNRKTLYQRLNRKT